MSLKRILLSLVLGAIAALIVGLNSLDVEGTISVLWVNIPVRVAYPLLGFIATAVVSLFSMAMIGAVLVDIYKIPELRNRILWTLGLLAIFRFGFWVYLPGIDIPGYKEMVNTGKGPLDWLTMTSRLTSRIGRSA